MYRYKVRQNTDEPELLAEIDRQLQENDGYCPCRLDKVPDTLCVCKEFREQIKDPSFEGTCHCGKYVKEIIER